MKASRRGFFATLAALPAVVRGRSAAAAERGQLTDGDKRAAVYGAALAEADSRQHIVLNIQAPLGDAAHIRREVQRIGDEYFRRTGRRV